MGISAKFLKPDISHDKDLFCSLFGTAFEKAKNGDENNAKGDFKAACEDYAEALKSMNDAILYLRKKIEEAESLLRESLKMDKQ